jgi:acyl-CoA synthetase (NDP forming)
MSEAIPEDYIEAAAAVVEAARKLEEAREEAEAAYQAHVDSLGRKSLAEKGLKEALERLKRASTGRDKK